ncbi:MAG: DUF4238 domain-containing protein [bacterium]|nr:DUF4238 domain-containing protein [bacterium]
MSNDGIAKVQHYVPQFLLRNWGNGKKDQIHAFDKRSEKSFATNVKNIASESRFYDFESSAGKISLEPGLSKLEGASKPIMEKIIEANSITTITTDEKSILADFLSVQFTRTAWYRSQLSHLQTIMQERVGSSSLLSISSTNEELKSQALLMLAKAPANYSVHFKNKIWLLLRTSKNHPFIICDNPLSMQNSYDFGLYGNIGIAVKGIEIYLPLSPTHALALWCPSHHDLFNKAREEIFGKLKNKSESPANLGERLINISNTIAAITQGVPLEYSEDNVLNFNSLQVYHSERYIFSNKNDFSLAQEMLNKNSELKIGPRSKAN